ncbi:Rieske 2Fe-2S domain-containing protein [Bradyrhizobium sp. WSM2254]|uniref:Rieske 2Fe-2S domain-containing protein n=1 Tax=Bradyrhizobium sp. WSM2254 TaxID=1188263 RepID=UPI00041397AA|nr:Rieske 2Fe-2S domain-containing protein [Bradyrhizobium sp. WSM2254]
MLSKENNDLICRVGRGTPMGELMRQYWIPALPSSEFPGPDCPPKRMMLLGEKMVMFRDSEGRMGALEEYCPHRGASLYFGRNEDGGLRCAYHGWKFDTSGKCLDTPTEQPDRREKFCKNIKARSYPCHEVNHMIWVYLGSNAPPPFPKFEINLLPETHVIPPLIMMEEANWLQNLEGDIDSTHLDWVHRRLHEDSPKPEKGMRGFWNPTGLPPVLDIVPTSYGAYYSAKRVLKDGSEWHRINQFIFPFHTMVTQGDGTIGLRSHVPVDDEHSMLIMHIGHPVEPMSAEYRSRIANVFEEVGGYMDRTNDPRSYFMTKLNKTNDYGRDWKVEKEIMFSGIPFAANLQDRAMTELMTNDKGEAIYDRTKEHLSASDAMIVTVRRQLINAATKFRDASEAPANVHNVELDTVRSASVRTPANADWRALTESARTATPGSAAAADVGLILD